MIEEALKIIEQEINAFFAKKTGSTDTVVAEQLILQNGSVTNGLDSKVVMMLVNVEEDRISKSHDIYRKQPNGTVEVARREVRLNMYVLFVAHFPSSNAQQSRYHDALKALSNVIGFFQSKNFFDTKNTPALDARVDKLLIELFSMTLEQQNHLWGSLGAKYMPSVMYRVRLVIIQEEELTTGGPPIQQIELFGKASNP
ncbi:MAG: DUF4255 domain-containing protein [Saprospiraceae bacterium]|nr:DUF4255 domain-containing protein [Saprospiraceae bacterium]